MLTSQDVSLGSVARLLGIVAIGSALTFSMGCSISASIESSLDILSSPFESSSASSDGEETAAFQEETEGFTATYVAAGNTGAESFQKGLSDIAAQRGISDWEANPATWTSVGRGLGQTGISEAAAANFAENLAAGDEQIVALLMQGYSDTL
jgi:hypothetical protein